MGAFICTISERDWKVARKLGVYGNRLYKEDSSKKLGDSQQLSIIRDLISMREGDIVFFHIRNRQTIHGVYKVRGIPYYDESKIWDPPDSSQERFPYRFLFEPHPKYRNLAEYDANIEVQSLYECIDQGKIKSLVTLENEQNIEARGVRKILVEDAEVLISLLHRDFKYRKRAQKLDFNPYTPPSSVLPLKECIRKVGQIENAIKAVLMYELAYNLPFVKKVFSNLDIFLTELNEVDFVNEFFIAQTARKSVDVYVVFKNNHVLIEVKTDKVNEAALRQALYYRDLLSQRPWINAAKNKIKIILIGKGFTKTLQSFVKKLYQVNNEIQLIQYEPVDKEGTWGRFKNVS